MSAQYIECREERRTNQGGHDGPKIIVCPAEPNDNKELPLIPTHSNLLDL